jgi:hypothetical protein
MSPIYWYIPHTSSSLEYLLLIMVNHGRVGNLGMRDKKLWVPTPGVSGQTPHVYASGSGT